MAWLGWAFAAIAMIFAAGALHWRAIAMRLVGAHIPRRAFAEHRALIADHVQLRLPDGEGPFPVVILLHGCGGPRDVAPAYAETAARAGVAALIVDSLAARGIDYETAVAEVCTGKRFWGRERAADIYAALELARHDARIDSQRIALAGWSHGGWSAMDAMALARAGGRPDGLQDAPSDPLAGLCGVFLVYPFASFPAIAARRRFAGRTPLEAALVRGDDRADPGDAERVLAREAAQGAPTRIDWFDGVTHAFDEQTHRADSHLRYDGEAAARLHALFADFLRRRLLDRVNRP